MKTRKTLYVDLDNVIADTDPCVRALIKKHVGISASRKAVTCFDYYKALKYSKSSESPVWEEFFDNGISKLQPIKGAISALERLSLFCRIEILTARQKNRRVEELTGAWLSKHRVPYDTFAIVTEAEKKKLVLENSESLLIDDRRKTLRELSSKGGSAILFDNPWNKSFSHRNITRLRNWKQIYSHILKHPVYEESVRQLYLRLLSRARKTLKHSYSPYSKYSVGASLMTTDDHNFDGCNVECVSFSPTICAERSAIVKAVSTGYKPGQFFAIAICARDSSGNFRGPSPCGVCCQVLAEFSNSDFPIIVVTPADDSKLTVRTINDYLPYSFSSF